MVALHLFYDYDSLNRLWQAREARGGQNQWVQRFDYDRWGNRTVNPSTWGAPAPQFGVEAVTNRLTAPPGYTMQYDPAGAGRMCDGWSVTSWGRRGWRWTGLGVWRA